MWDTTPQQFKDVIEKIIDTRIENKGITNYISAIVDSINEDGTLNVYIPPEKDKIITRMLNKTGEELSVGDSVEICTKNGLLKNSWIALKHGISSSPSPGVFGSEHVVGSIIEYAGLNEPDGWLICNGRELNRENYSELFDIIGTKYGEGDGTTTFNIPDLRGRVVVGHSEEDADFGIIGAKDGEKNHVLTASEMPSHWHTIKGYKGGEQWGTGEIWFRAAGSGSGNTPATTSTATAGDGLAHNNMPPYIVVNYIIKVTSKTIVPVADISSVVDSLNSLSIDKALSANQGRILNEKIKIANDYSVEEQEIGTYLNKKLYRKVLVLNSPITFSYGNWVNLFERTDEDKIINGYALDDYVSIPLSFNYDKSNSYIRAMCYRNTNQTINENGNIILEYIKNTN